MDPDRGKKDPIGAILAVPREEPALDWQTESAAQVLQRERERSRRGVVTRIAEPSLDLRLTQRESEWPTEWDGVEWGSYAWAPEGHRPTLGPSGARVSTRAQRLIATERAKARRSKPADFPPPRRGQRAGSGRSFS